jgi:hypothetical protein
MTANLNPTSEQSSESLTSTITSSKQSAYRIAVVTWGDAFIESDDFTYEDAVATEPVWRTTVGYLICRNRYGYVLATDVYNDLDEIAGKLFVPHGMVTGIRYLT